MPLYGKLTTICGPMYSGKTTELLKRILWARNLNSKAVLVIKPSFDTRYSKVKIVSHDGLKVDAKAITAWDQIATLAADADMICIDEVQFFDKDNYDGDIVEEIRQTLVLGTDVVVSGLDMDWQGNAFPITAACSAMADEIVKLHANCTVCGGKAAKTHKLAPNAEQVELGSHELYEARCNTHWGA